MTPPAPPRWWQRGIVYQIYPRSFMDSDGDGVGDLTGIERRLDHVAWLGVDAVWISPFYPSPMADFGYDVSDHTAVHPLFGTLDDFDRLVRAARARGLRVLVDFVPNHVSDQHPWFVESRASRTSPKRDWFIWRDPAPGGGPPNNWLAVFGGSAWEWDERTRQYYYHAFLREQPDLDWRNPAVRDAMLDVLRFWLRRGVAGFRVDAIHHLVEDAALRDEPPNPDFRPELGSYSALLHTHTLDQPEVHDAIAAMRRVLDECGDDTVMVTEAYLPVDRVVMYYGENGGGAHLPFNFQLVELPWDACTIARTVAAYEAALPPGAWPNWVLGNHDRPRVATRVGDAQARVAAMLLLTLRGTPTLYQGEEIGMRDVPIPPERVQDPWEKNQPGLGLGRDPERTPMQWDASKNAGFTTGRPWLPLSADHARLNVAAQTDDPRSMLSLHRRLIALRRAEPALSVGSWQEVEAAGDVIAFVREHDGRRFLVALNLGHALCEVAMEGAGRVVLSTHLDREESVTGVVRLRADEGVVVQLS
ncbi:MAG: alpha-amylase family glycosyl hydrolase [Gemmatimonadaceae bacterium]